MWEVFVADDMVALGKSLRSVAPGIEKLAACYERDTRARSRFNLFTILWPAHYEVQLHTKFLTHLLDPRGDHGYGHRFLWLFIKTLAETHMPAHDDEPGTPALRSVVSEFPLKPTVASVGPKNTDGYGNIDILIECCGWGVIVIENKIWAGDQEDQLARYAQYIANEHRGGNSLLLYLTRYGTPSPSAGDTCAKYYRISYREHILPWLESCRQEIAEHPDVGHALDQYRDVVYQIIGERPPMEERYMSELTNILMQHPAIIENIDRVITAIDELRKKCWRQFTDELGTAIQQQRSVPCHVERTDCGEDDFRYYVVSEASDAAREGGFDFEVGQDKTGLFVGVSLRRKTQTIEKLDKKTKDQFMQIESVVNSGRHVFKGQWYWPCGGWYLLTQSTGTLAKLANSGDAGTLAKATAKEVITYIDRVTVEWKRVSKE